MKLVMLGTAGYHPNDQRQTASMVLPEIGVVLDAGTGLYRLRDLLATSELDIFLTHTHLDHVVGLTFLLDILHERDVNRVTVHARPEKLAVIRDHLLVEELFPAPLPCDYAPLEGPRDLPEGGRLSFFPLRHPGGAVGFRLDWEDRSLAYVTDTTADVNAPYVDLIRDVDVLVHECNFPDGMEDMAELTGHSCTTAVAHVAKTAQAGRLVLTHLLPIGDPDDPIGVAAAQAIFPQTELAYDGMEIIF